MSKKQQYITGLLLFFSGTAALIYQTLWIKQLGLVLGVDVYAVTTGVAAFFAGLALGGLLIGKIADKFKNPFKLFAYLELGIGVIGILATYLLSNVPELFVSVQQFAGPLAWIIPFLLVGTPAFVMGGTFPVVISCLAPKQNTIGMTSGSFYAINTFGAILGTALVPFFLIPTLGVLNTSLFAGGINLLIAITAYSLDYSLKRNTKPEERVEKIKKSTKIALILYAISGGIALGYEVVWSQALAPLLSSRVYAFATMLSVYLLGLVVGSFLYGRYADKSKNPWRIFGLLIIGAGFSALILFFVLDSWTIEFQDTIGKSTFSITKSNMIANIARFASTAFIILFIPTLLLGAAFPAASRIIAKEQQIGRDMGIITASNTGGGILGTMFTGFVLIPVFGIMKTLGILAITASLIGCYALIKESNNKRRTRMVSTFTIFVFVVLALILPKDKIAQILVQKRGGETIFYSEKAGGSVAVIEQKTPNSNFRRLYIHGFSNSGDGMASLRYMRLQALLPLIIHNEQPKSAMVIGFGTGITFGALLAYSNLEDKVCIELMPGVLEAAKYFEGNLNVINDNTVDIRVNDGRHELLGNEQKYDLITLEPPPPSSAGVVNLYSSEFYNLANKRLHKNGMVAQWLPLATQNIEETKSLVRSFLDEFPYASLWTTELHETLLIGSNEPILIDYKRIQEKFQDSVLSKRLKEAGIMSANELISTYITDREGLVAFAEKAKPVTDNYPSIEYAGWTRKGEFPRVLTAMSGISIEIPLVNADEGVADEIDISRQKLWTLYRAAYWSYLGDKENSQAMLKQLIPELKTNPYFRSFVPERP